MRITLAGKIRSLKDSLSSHMVYSMLLFPTLAAGLASFALCPLAGVAAVIFFYAVNRGFLRFCRETFGTGFMLQAALLIPADCLMGYIGSFLGLLDHLRRRRL